MFASTRRRQPPPTCCACVRQDAVQAKAEQVVDDVKAAPGKALLNAKLSVEEQEQKARDAVAEAKRERDAQRERLPWR